jgi:hypothetical protein
MKIAYFIIFMLLVPSVTAWTMTDTKFIGPVNMTFPLTIMPTGAPTAPFTNAIKLYASNGVPYYRNTTGSYILSGGSVTGGSGDVVGPAGATSHNFASYASASGKTLEDSGTSALSFADASATTNALALKATKVYADSKINKTGDTMAGNLAMGGSKLTGLGFGSASADSVNYWQMLTQGYTKINKSGDAMSGPLAMGASKVTGVLNGTVAQDAVTYSQLVESGSPGAVFVGPYSDYKAKFYDYVTLGDSTDTAVINAALLKSYTRGHKVILMPGVYLQSTSQIVVPPYCTLEGLNSPFQSRFASAGYPEAIPVRTAKEVARINVTQKTLGAVWLKGSATCIRNIEFFYGTQKTNSTPDVYNASIWACGNGNIPTENAIIEYINFMNAYTAVDAGSGNHDRMIMQHCIGMPLRYGLIDDTCFDIDEINDIHWNPNPVLAFSPTLMGSVLEAWTKTHGVGYKIGRSDSTRLRGCFDIWHAYGIMVVGPWYGGSITDCYMDHDTVSALWINGTMERCLVSDSSFYCSASTAINTVSPGNCYLCKFDGNVVYATGTAFGVFITGTYNTLSDNTIIDYGDSSNPCYGIIVFGAANSINNNLIKTTHTHTYGLYWDGTGCNVGGNSVYDAALGPNALGAGSTTYCIVGNLASGCGGAWTADSSTANKKVGLNTFI